MRFDEVLPALVEGKRIRRAGWPEHIWLVIAQPAVVRAHGAGLVDPESMSAYIGMGSDEERLFVPWAVDTSALLQQDWEIIA